MGDLGEIFTGITTIGSAIGGVAQSNVVSSSWPATMALTHVNKSLNLVSYQIQNGELSKSNAASVCIKQVLDPQTKTVKYAMIVNNIQESDMKNLELFTGNQNEGVGATLVTQLSVDLINPKTNATVATNVVLTGIEPFATNMLNANYIPAVRNVQTTYKPFAPVSGISIANITDNLTNKKLFVGTTLTSTHGLIKTYSVMFVFPISITSPVGIGPQPYN